MKIVKSTYGGDTEVSSCVDVKGDGETWVDYAHRLERRIKAQRDHIESLSSLRGSDGNRKDRKRIAALERTLGAMTLRWQLVTEEFRAYRAKGSA